MGLSEREAKVYQVLVSVSEITASAIPRYTSISRPKVYEVLDSLIVKGFIRRQQFRRSDLLCNQSTILWLVSSQWRGQANELKSIMNWFFLKIYTTTPTGKDADFIEVLQGGKRIIHRYTGFVKMFKKRGVGLNLIAWRESLTWSWMDRRARCKGVDWGYLRI